MTANVTKANSYTGSTADFQVSAETDPETGVVAFSLTADIMDDLGLTSFPYRLVLTSAKTGAEVIFERLSNQAISPVTYIPVGYDKDRPVRVILTKPADIFEF